MPIDDGARLEVKTQEEVTRPDLEGALEGPEAPGAAASGEATGLHDLLGFFEAEAGAATSRERRAECLWALGWIQKERLGDARAAATAFRQAFAADPTLLPNLGALRQLRYARGHWSGVLETLDAELRATKEPEAKAEIALLRGRVFEEQLANPEAAREAYAEALALAPGHRAALAFAEALEERLGDPERLFAAYERRVQSSGDRVERSLLLEAMARLREENPRPGSAAPAPAEPPPEASAEPTPTPTPAPTSTPTPIPEPPAAGPPPLVAEGQAPAPVARPDEPDEPAAMQLDALALREDPTNAAARRALKRLYHKHGRWAELAEVLLTEADLAASDPARVVAYTLAGRVLDQRLGQRDRALDIYRRAIAIAPDDALALCEVGTLCHSLGRWEEAYQALERLARGGADVRLRASYHLLAGRLAEERLGQDERALLHYTRARELDPRCGPALAALGRLHARRGDHAELVRLLVAEADGMADPGGRAARLYKAGAIVLERLEDPERAAELMARALRADPAFLPAVVALERLYRSLGRYPELAELYAQELGWTTDDERRAELWEALAEVHGRHTGDLARATVALDELRKLGAQPAPRARALRQLLGVLERTGKWRELAEAMAELAAAAHDPRQAATLWHHAGDLWEDHAGELDRAAACHRRALDAVPTYVPSLQALGRIDGRRGQIGEVIAALEREIEATTAPEARAALLYRLGELFEGLAGPGEGEGASVTPAPAPALGGGAAGSESSLPPADREGRPTERLRPIDRAASAYRAALAAVPGYGPALLALERLYRREGKLAALVELLLQAADGAPGELEKATRLYRAGQVREERLGDLVGAADAYGRALLVVPDHAPSLEALERLYAAGGHWLELADVRRRAAATAVDDAARIAAWTALGELLWRRLGDADGAIQALQRALEIDGHDAGALRQLERLLLETGRFGGLVEVYERLAERADEPEAQVALWRRAAAVRESREQPTGDPTPFYERVLEAAPHDRAALEALDRLHAARDEPEDLARVLDASLDLHPDGRTASALLFRLGACAEALGNLEDAVALCERAVQTDPGFLPAVRELRRLLEVTGDAPRLATALAEEAAACKNARFRVHALARAASLALGRLHDEDRAAAWLRQAVEIDPRDEEVGTRLEQLYGRREQWMQAAELLEHRAGGARPDERVALLVRLADVYRDRLDRPGAAIEVLRRVVAVEPNHVPSLVTLGDLYAATLAWPDAVAAYGRAVAVAEEPQVLRQVHLKLGEIWDLRLGDARRAISFLQNVLAIDLFSGAPPAERPPEAQVATIAALERMAAIFLRESDWPSAADALARLAALDPDPARAVEHELRLAQVHASGFGDPAGAIAAYRRALTRDPANAAAVRGLEEACARAAHPEPLAAALEASAEALPPTQIALRAERRVRAAGVLADLLAKPEEAVRLYRAVLAENAEHVEARMQLARVLGRLGRGEEAIREHRQVLQVDPVRVASYRELRRLYDRAGEHDRGFLAAQALRYLRAADDLEERYLKERRARAPREPQAVLVGDLFERALVHPGEQHPGRALLAALYEALARLYPARLEDWGLTRADRVLRPEDPLRTLVDPIARALGIDLDFELFVSRARPKEVEIECTEPPALIVGSGVLTSVPAPEQRFLVGRALLRLLGRTLTVRRLTATELEVLTTGAVRLVVPRFGGQSAPEEALVDVGKRIARALPRRSRRLFEEAAEAFAAGRPLRYDVWLRAMEHTANRGGLLVGNDLGAALDVIRRGERRAAVIKSSEELAAAVRANPEAAELLRFALSDDFFSLRRSLGLAIVA